MRTAVRRAYETTGLPSRVAAVVVAVAGGLRATGVPVSTGETVDAIAALAQLDDLADRGAVRDALRATLVKDGDHETEFQRVFDRLFPRPRAAPAVDRPGTGGPGDAGDRRDALAEALRAGDDEQVELLLSGAVDEWAGVTGVTGTQRHHVQRVLRRLDLSRVLQQLARGEPDRDELQRRADATEAAARVEQVRRLIERLVAERLAEAGGPRPDGAPTPAADLEDRAILRVGPEELTALRGAVRPLARRLASRLGRRRRRGHGGLDMRRTVRASLSSGGVPLAPQLRRRSPSKPDLVVLCDVSGSVAQFAPFTLALLHALHAEFRRVRSWVFIDGAVEITDLLAAAPGVLDAHHLLGRRGLVARDGRSDYGHAFSAFLAGAADAVTAKTTVIVVGDARGHDRRPALSETARLHARARRLYWLNPEPAAEWDTGDSVMSAYASHCTRVFEVATLRQLGDCVAAIA